MLWRRHLAEAGVVLAVLLVLEGITFARYFSGELTPGFDFFGTYNSEAYAWWQAASAPSIPDWMPQLWGGYPAVVNLQNSSFYLPVGVASLFGGHTIQVAAVVSALHVAFGAAGAYLFVRRWGAGAIPSLLALVAWFFAVGFFANATHVDIARGSAWLPWLMLVLSVRWPWARWWSAAVGALIVSQAILGTYPGILVAFGYSVGAWIIVQLVVYRPGLRAVVIPAAVTAIAGALLTLVRFLPALAVRGGEPFVRADVSTFGPRELGTLLYPYSYDVNGGYALFVAVFLPAGIIALLPFVVRAGRSRRMLCVAVPGAVAALLGFPFWPWHELVTSLPGMALSRFRLSDFKVVLLFCLVALAALALDALLRRQLPVAELRERLRDWRFWVPGLLGLTGLAVLAAIGLRYPYAAVPSVLQWLLLLCGLLLAASLALARPQRIRTVLAGALVVVTAGSGIIAVYGGNAEWRIPRVETEAAYFGAPISELIAPGGDERVRRPARLAPPPPDQPQDNLAGFYSAGFYDGSASVYGYVNLVGVETFAVVRASVADGAPRAVDHRVFWSAAGLLIRTPGGIVPSTAQIDRCESTGSCGDGFSADAVGYRTGFLAYRVQADRTSTISANEAWYPGWRTSLCPAVGGACFEVQNRRGPAGQVVFDLPAGTWTVQLEYRLPRMTQAWAAFALGVLMTLGVTIALARRGRSRTAQRPRQ